MPSNAIGGHSPEFDPDTEPRRGDFLLLQRVLNLGVAIPDSARESLGHGVTWAAKLAVNPKKPDRIRLSALRVLGTIEKMNIDIALKLLDKRFPDKIEMQDDQQETADDLARQLRDDREYIAFARKKRREAAGPEGKVGRKARRKRGPKPKRST
tara:strand:- start:5284 stop:5745 length:462 start_codon:yes stop_codon:yes gene_type:complete